MVRDTHRSDITMTWRAILAGFVMLAAAAGAQAHILKQEPPMGALKEGQRVLVDNGSCGRGKILEVIGGNHVEAGGYKRTKRTKRCIAR
jgi:hypothetical protein